MSIKLSTFVKLVPEAARSRLPTPLRKFNMLTLPWLAQLYYDDKLIHYEIAKLPLRFGENRIEIGLHFESKQSGLNAKLLAGFERYLFEVREALGADWWAEQWDRGWTKVYTTRGYLVLDDDYVEEMAALVANMISVLHPLVVLLRT
jgi:hypothetical protein